VTRLLELPAFRRLVLTAMLNELAWSIGSVALAVLVYRRTGSAIGAASFFLCSQFGPALVSPLFVSRLDQRSARAVLAVLYSLEGVVFLALAWVAGRFSLVPVLGLALIDGILALVARVLARAAWTSVSSAAGLMREGNAAINAGFSVCFLVGPALGGALVALWGARTTLLVNVGVFALIVLAIGTARGLPRSVPDRGSTASRLRSALNYSRGEPVIRRLLGLQALAILFFTISIPVEVIFAQRSLHAGAGGYGALLSAWGAGAIAGSVVYARWRFEPSRELITLGTCALAAGFLAMAVAPSLGVAIAGSAIAGFGNGMQVVAVRTALQEAVAERWMALMLSLNESIFQAVPGAGILLGGAIASLAGPRAALATGAAGSFLVALTMWVKLRPLGPITAPIGPAPEPELAIPREPTLR
jgi:predicted MFS family arabinose efflux permease